MSKARIYPKADAKTQWWETAFSRGTFTAIEKILLHTTETTGWPSYQSGAIAPTLTYKVATREWRQHNFLNTSARALGDPSSTPVRENRDNVIQIEIIWYAAKAASLPDSAYRDLAAFIAFVRKEWGGPPLLSAKFVGETAAANAHMTSTQYDGFKGILGHQHAPSPSTHWDPGAIDSAKLLSYVKELETVSTPPAPTTPTSPTTLPAPPAGIPAPNTYQIWWWDGIYEPYRKVGSTNPFWAPGKYLIETYKKVDALTQQVNALAVLVKELAAKVQ